MTTKAINHYVAGIISTVYHQHKEQQSPAADHRLSTGAMDVDMDVTPLPPSEILARHSHSTLLPSPFPNVSLARWSTYRPTSWHRPPAGGVSPISSLPTEVLLNIFSNLDLKDLLPLREVCRRWDTVALDPTLHTTLHITQVPEVYPLIVQTRLIQVVKHLDIHLFPCPSRRSTATVNSLLALLDQIPPGRLESLSLPFSTPYCKESQLEQSIRRIGGRLRNLDLKGSSLAGDGWIGWIGELGKQGRGLEMLDLGFTSITTLPVLLPTSPDPFRNLTWLSLASCSHLSTDVISSFLENLPVTVEELDLSRLDNATFSALWNTRVVKRCAIDEMDEGDAPTCLKRIKVVGVDHLTRLDIRRLKRHWEDQRRACLRPSPWSSISNPVSVIPTKWAPPSAAPLTPPDSPDYPQTPPSVSMVLGLPTPPSSVSPPPAAKMPCPKEEDDDAVNINIVHSAILESEDEQGYRQFIGEIIHGTLPPVNFGYRPPEGLGLGFGRELGMLTFASDFADEW